MTTAAWIMLVGGLPVGLACAIAWERIEATEEDWTSAVVALWAIQGVITRLERHIPDRRSRADLEQQIRELEQALAIGDTDNQAGTA